MNQDARGCGKQASKLSKDGIVNVIDVFMMKNK